jgi:amino acid adenylation domain-containing protein
VETLKPKRELSRPPLFQVLFNLQNAPMPKLEIAGIGTAFLEIDRGVSQFDMTLMISQVENQCHATVEYNSDLFQPATIERMFRSYQMLLENVVSQPDLKICQLQLMDQEEFHRIVYALNHTEVDFPREKCIHRLIEEQAGKTPNSIALIFNESQLTYRELNQRANVLARQLQELGVGPEVRVGILMKRSMEVVVALLGVLKAGGAYVPVPAATPIQRVQFFLKDSDAQVLLTNIYFQQSYEFNGHIINLNDKVFQPGMDSSNLSTFVRPDNIAYVIYTSGSTGQPKGVMVEHRSLVNFLSFMKGRPGMDEKNVVLALTSIGFDISIMELFLPLLTGAKVVIANDEMTTSPLMISETINQHDVNFVQATPATWQLLLDSGWNGAPGLKALCGGDVLARRMADRLLKCVSSLWNLYGPTETTVWSSVGEVKADNNPITIGQPIGNTQMYILDRYQQPVPIGVIGELYISGAGLARAYLNSPELTREKFIPNRFSTETSSRLYKTGDRARYLPDFNIEVLGRIDDQVKVQGHRVELGEITAVLMEHPALTDAIVIARQESTGETRLVAYFVSKHDPSPEPGKLREFLGKKLPAYMIPVFFVKMDVLPLTSSRKVDRKALPVPEASRHRSLYIAPRNEEEQILAQIWQNVLDVEQVGIEDNFFDLGGASIQSIQVVSEAYMYGYLISVANIFEYSTIAQLAKQINFKSNNAEEEQHALDQQTC